MLFSLFSFLYFFFPFSSFSPLSSSTPIELAERLKKKEVVELMKGEGGETARVGGVRVEVVHGVFGVPEGRMVPNLHNPLKVYGKMWHKVC